MQLLRIGVVKLANAPYPKHVTAQALLRILLLLLLSNQPLDASTHTFEGVVTNYRGAVD